MPPVSAEEAALPLVAPKRQIVLPLPAELGRSVDAAQIITLRRDGKVFAFEARLSVTPERLLLVGVDSLGRRAMTMHWSEAGLSSEVAPWVPSTLRPGSVLADLVLLYWPEPAVRTALARSGMTFAGSPRERSILGEEGPILKASYGFDLQRRWTGHLHYRNYAWGYEVEILSEELGS
jgi:hypothetical protein